MKIIVVAKTPEHQQRLSEHVPFIRVVFGTFGGVGVERALIPKEVIFKAIISRNLSDRKNFQTMTRGKAGYNKEQWWMAVNINLSHKLLMQKPHKWQPMCRSPDGIWGHRRMKNSSKQEY
jgi:hypothetical protein